MEDKDYLAFLPQAPPPDIVSWLRADGGFKREYLVYRADRWRDPLTGMSEKMVRAVCTRCHESMLLDYVPGASCGRMVFGFLDGKNEPVNSGMTCICPACGAGATAYHISAGFPFRYDEWVMCAERRGDAAVLTGWLVSRSIDKEGCDSYSSHLYEAYIFKGRKVTRVAGHLKIMGGYDRLTEPQVRKTAQDCWGECAHFYPFCEDELAGTPIENSKLSLYLQTESSYGAMPVSYLKGYLKKPQVENLLVQGMGHIVRESVQKDCGRAQYYGCGGSRVWKFTGIDVKEKAPARMLGLSRPQMEQARQRLWNIRQIEAFCRMQQTGQRVTADEFDGCVKIGILNVERLLDWKVSVLKAVRYLQKQKRADGHILFDYWQMAMNEGIQLEGGAMWPADLWREHDRVMRIRNERLARQKMEKQSKEMAGRAQRFKSLQERFAAASWEAEGICIRIAASEAELVEEGIRLNHCVGGYGEAHVNGKSIFFVRRAEDPQQPWYTLQVSVAEGRMLQLHGKNNDRDVPIPEEVKAFCARWLSEVLRPMLGAKSAA